MTPITPKRRDIVKGMSWVAPIVLASTAIPAYAASQNTTKPCKESYYWANLAPPQAPAPRFFQSTVQHRLIPPTGGLWVGGVKTTDKITSATVTFYVPTSLGALNWVNTRLAADPTYVPVWSTPKVDTTVPQRSGYTAYTMRYSGGWTYNSADKTYIAEVPPKFTAKITYATCTPGITAYATRSVTVNGTVYSFTREPVTI